MMKKPSESYHDVNLYKLQIGKTTVENDKNRGDLNNLTLAGRDATKDGRPPWRDLQFSTNPAPDTNTTQLELTSSN